MKLQLTNDNSSYTSYDYTSMYFVAHAGNGWNWSSANQEVLIDITNTTNDKVRFRIGCSDDTTWAYIYGTSGTLTTGATFRKVGET